MVKFQIVGGSLEILNGATKLSVIPTKNIMIDSIALYNTVPKIILYNANVGNNEELFSQNLSDVTDENDVAFTVGSFIDFAIANFGLAQSNIVPSPSVSSSTLPYKLISDASTNANVVKDSQGNVYTILAIGLIEEVRYLKFYDKATAPTVGTDTPILTIPIPTNVQGAGVVIPISFGVGFSNGIAFAITSGSADADTGAIGAGDVIVNLTYV
jgi:hypothetical protein